MLILIAFRDRDEEDQIVDGDAVATEEPAKEVKRSAWARPQRRKGGGGGGAGAKNKHKPGTVKPRGQTVKTTAAQAASAAAAAVAASAPNTDGKTVEKSQPIKDLESDADSGQESEADEKEDPSTDDEKKVSSVEDDDVEWEKFQQKLNKREKLEGKSKMSHSVHCPYYPEDKQEYWWTYICDRKSKTLLTAPYNVTNLVDMEEIQLKFTAPRWPGVYTFTVCLRSGSTIFGISIFQRSHLIFVHFLFCF